MSYEPLSPEVIKSIRDFVASLRRKEEPDMSPRRHRVVDQTKVEPVKVRLWYIMETEKAWQLSTVASSAPAAGAQKIWLPKSQVKEVTRHPLKAGELWPEWVLTLPTWLAEEKELV